MVVEIYCNNNGTWANTRITELAIWKDSAIRGCEDCDDGYRYYFDDEDRIIYRMERGINMSTTTILIEAGAGENIIDMFKSVYHVLSHPDVNKAIIIHNGTKYTITKEEK